MSENPGDDAEEVNSLDCRIHGERPAGSVCKHQLDGVGRGFFTPDGNLDSIVGWCRECELHLQETGFWDEDYCACFFVAICDLCLPIVKSRHHLMLVADDPESDQP